MEKILNKVDVEEISGEEVETEDRMEEEYISEVKNTRVPTKEDIEEILEEIEKEYEPEIVEQYEILEEIENECDKENVEEKVTSLTMAINDTGVKELGINWVKENVLNANITYTKLGSLSYLLHGSRPSEQSISIRMGKFGEFKAKELIKCNSNLELLTCGVQQINNKKKDVDLIFKDGIKKIIYYRELKGNIELDTEKVPATVAKCNEITASLRNTYPEYTVDCAILNWSVYNRSILKAGLPNISSFETRGIKIEHMENFLKIVDIEWEEEDYYQYFREIGSMIVNSHLN